MRCYFVLIHGTLEWQVPLSCPDDTASQPHGFYCHRYVLALNEQRAIDSAFARVRANLNRTSSWLSEGAAILTLNAEEVRQAPFSKLFRPENEGHVFYDE